MIAAEPKPQQYPTTLASGSLGQSLLASELSMHISSLETTRAPVTDYWWAYLSPENDNTSFLAFYNDVLSLMEGDGDDAPATPHALGLAIDISQKVFARLSTAWRNPVVSTDGGGGVRLRWKTAGKEIRAVIPSRPTRPQYLYVETPDKHYTVKNFTALSLFEELK
jgi:hypothetical protein